MKFRTTSPSAAAKRARAAFTLAEVLAAMLLMAIVIPVAMQGVRVASLSGQVAERKAAAVRIAERMLNETIITGQSTQSSQKGTVQEGRREYRWQMRTETWPQGALRMVTVEVIFPVQGRDYEVSLSTLVDPNAQ